MVKYKCNKKGVAKATKVNNMEAKVNVTIELTKEEKEILNNAHDILTYIHEYCDICNTDFKWDTENVLFSGKALEEAIDLLYEFMTTKEIQGVGE